MDGFAARHPWLALSTFFYVGSALAILATSVTSYMIVAAILPRILDAAPPRADVPNYTTVYTTVAAVAPTQAAVQTCDRVVATLLETRDLVEVSRAGWLAQLMRCDVARRLPRPG